MTIYGLQLEIPTFEAAQERVSPTAQRDLHVRHDGVSRVVGAARGAVFRQVGTDPKPFERIARELTGYYLLAFEARDGDRDGRPHRIRAVARAPRRRVARPHRLYVAGAQPGGARRRAHGVAPLAATGHRAAAARRHLRVR